MISSTNIVLAICYLDMTLATQKERNLGARGLSHLQLNPKFLHCTLDASGKYLISQTPKKSKCTQRNLESRIAAIKIPLTVPPANPILNRTLIVKQWVTVDTHIPFYKVD